jgi:hypothetical protein
MNSCKVEKWNKKSIPRAYHHANFCPLVEKRRRLENTQPVSQMFERRQLQQPMTLRWWDWAGIEGHGSVDGGRPPVPEMLVEWREDSWCGHV